jgi:hypothetical protein
MKLRLVTAGVGAAWEAALVSAQVLHRCYDLGDLLAVAAAGQAEAAVVAAGTRWLDRDALTRLAAAGLAVVGVAPAGDEDSERRLRQLGLHQVAYDTDPPDALVERARTALAAEPDPTADEPAGPRRGADPPRRGRTAAPGRRLGTQGRPRPHHRGRQPGLRGGRRRRRGPAGRRRHLRWRGRQANIQEHHR